MTIEQIILLGTPVKNPVEGLPLADLARKIQWSGAVKHHRDGHIIRYVLRDEVNLNEKGAVVLVQEEWENPGYYTWTAPDRVENIDICMIGGGGGGSQYYYECEMRGGGYAGGIYSSQGVGVTPGNSYAIIVGEGGNGGTSGHCEGHDGTDSKFSAAIASGGAGGSTSTYAGNGASRETCAGTFNDGLACQDNNTTGGYGGQAGFANGGKGNDWEGTCTGGQNGSRGSGGGASDNRGSYAGKGGDGVVRITYEPRPVVSKVYVGDEEIDDITLGSDYIDCIYQGDIHLWCRDGSTPPPTPDPVPPGTITDFAASDNKIDVIEFTWTNVDGYPIPKYDIYNDSDTLVAEDVSSGYVHSYPAPYTDIFYVKAYNSEGETISNTDEGSSVETPTCIPPGDIDDLEATRDNESYATITWSSAGGDPSPVYNLYIEGAGKVASNVTSPYNDYRSNATRTYYVVATNDCGSSESNHDTAEEFLTCDPGSYEFNTPGNHTWNSGACTSATACMIGGGASGTARATYTPDQTDVPPANGGRGGSDVSRTTSFSSNTNLTVSVGSGGSYTHVPANNGVQWTGSNPGSSSSFNGITASGGSNSGYAGNGGGRSTCYGSTNDGLLYPGSLAYGGQAGFNAGGSGFYASSGTVTASNGYKGSGGGGANCNIDMGGSGAYSGAGGSGVVRISTSSYKGLPRLVELMDQDELKKNRIEVYGDTERYYKYFRTKANHLLALWELTGYDWQADYLNAGRASIFRKEIDSIKIKYKDDINELANIINTPFIFEL